MKKIITILIFTTLLSFKTADNRSIYNVPLKASAVCAADQNLDGNIDIFTEHLIDSETSWGGTYILENDGYGHFSFMDSMYYSTGMHDVYADTVLNNVYPDIISGNGEYVNFLSYDGQNFSQKRFYMGSHINKFDIGDVDNNGYIDVVFISNQERYWGIIYNNGDGTFTNPKYYDLDYPPLDIACKDLNSDGKYDFVIVGSSSYIYISTSPGFEITALPHRAGHVHVIDLDNDGDNDIISFSDTYIMSFVYLYENLGNNVFDTVNNFTIDDGCAGFFVTDFNNDSLPDVLFSTSFNNEGYFLHYNQGNFQFGEPQIIDLIYYGEGWRSTYCADMDGNSFADIITARRSFDTIAIPSILEILFNDGQGNFVDDPLTSVNTKPADNTTTKFINYPNPTRTGTTFKFTIGLTSHIEISVYNLQGKLVKSLINKTMKGGTHSIIWNVSQACKPGPYIAYLKVNESLVQSIKIFIQ